MTFYLNLNYLIHVHPSYLWPRGCDRVTSYKISIDVRYIPGRPLFINWYRKKQWTIQMAMAYKGQAIIMLIWSLIFKNNFSNILFSRNIIPFTEGLNTPPQLFSPAYIKAMIPQFLLTRLRNQKDNDNNKTNLKLQFYNHIRV